MSELGHLFDKKTLGFLPQPCHLQHSVSGLPSQSESPSTVSLLTSAAHQRAVYEKITVTQPLDWDHLLLQHNLTHTNSY